MGLHYIFAAHMNKFPSKINLIILYRKLSIYSAIYSTGYCLNTRKLDSRRWVKAEGNTHSDYSLGSGLCPQVFKRTPALSANWAYSIQTQSDDMNRWLKLSHDLKVQLKNESHTIRRILILCIIQLFIIIFKKHSIFIYKGGIAKNKNKLQPIFSIHILR